MSEKTFIVIFVGGGKVLKLPEPLRFLKVPNPQAQTAYGSRPENNEHPTVRVGRAYALFSPSQWMDSCLDSRSGD